MARAALGGRYEVRSVLRTVSLLVAVTHYKHTRAIQWTSSYFCLKGTDSCDRELKAQRKTRGSFRFQRNVFGEF